MISYLNSPDAVIQDNDPRFLQVKVPSVLFAVHTEVSGLQNMAEVRWGETALLQAELQSAAAVTSLHI